MAKTLIPDELWTTIEPLLPPERPRPKGDARARRQECRARGIAPRIARRAVDTGERLGRYRWVVERTHAWFNRFRRIPIRHERRSDIYEAFTSLAASIITINQIIRFC